jgi:malonyl-CoA O-methyltransferase
MALIDRLRFGMPKVVEPFKAYQAWAPTYDHVKNNGLLFAEQSVIEPMLLQSKLRGKRVLDAGCGTGRYLTILKKFRPRYLAGVDFSPAMIAHARRKFRHDRSFHLAIASLDSLPYRNSYFDFTLCTLALDHLECLQDGVDELSRVTRRGGSVLISVFHPVGEHLGWQRTFRTEESGQLFAVRYFSRWHSEYFKAFSKAKLTVTELLEPRLDESLKPFYESRSKLDIYESFKGLPLLLIFRLMKR